MTGHKTFYKDILSGSISSYLVQEEIEDFISKYTKAKNDNPDLRFELNLNLEDYGSSFELKGLRDETDEELKNRLAAEKLKLDNDKANQLKYNEEREKKEYLRLKKKFEK